MIKKYLIVLAISFVIVLSFASAVKIAKNDREILLASLSPPPQSARQPAEFERMEGVLIRYPFGISYSIIAEMSEDVEVITIVASQSEADSVESLYASNGVNIAHTNYLIAPSDRHWTRDYGPWFVFDGDDELSVIDFTYNRPRPNDNAIPAAFAVDQGMDSYFMSLEHTGGNYMTDGQGISVSTDLVYTENSVYTPSQIDSIVYNYLGIDTYNVVDDALGEYIEHIDCWAKYLSPDTIMIIEVSPSHSSYDEIEDAVDYFESQTSCYGTPYNVERVYTHLSEPYINCLILNDKVLVPITGSQWDDDAIASFEAAMPGYEVIGFTGNWYNTDALHCRTKGIPDRDMLYIEHIPITGSQNTANGVGIQAKIIPYSGLILTQEKVKYKVNSGSWQIIQMTSIGGDNYQATIPPVPHGSTVSYYIYATDGSGRVENHPFIGQPDPHTFTAVNPDTPNNPSKPSGPSKGFPGETITYTTNTTDPNDDQVQYGWDWNGDDVVDEWTDFFDSEITVSISHSWSEEGSYYIKVKARDINNYTSGFSPTKKVKIYENEPPYNPSDPFPENGAKNVSLNIVLSWTGGDPNNDDVIYDVYFGTKSDQPHVSSDQTSTSYNPGVLNYETNYFWKIIAEDEYGAMTEGPIWGFTTIDKPNSAPEMTINGPTKGKAGTQYNYTFTVTDEDEDDYYLWIDWCDENIEDWIGPYEYGEGKIISHKWTEKGSYIVRAKARDINGAESSIQTIEVSMPKYKIINPFEKFLENHPYIFPLLRKLLRI